MSSHHRKNKLDQFINNRLLIAGLIVSTCILSAFVFAYISQHSNSSKSVPQNGPQTSTSLYNEKTFKEVFLANCTIQAKSNLSEVAAMTYCTCVLDRGIEVYGINRFVEINQEIAKTYNLSGLKDIIDQCVASTIDRQSNRL